MDDLKENLRAFSIAKNSIRYLSGLENLVNLTFITLQSNRLTKIENLGTLINLKELYLSQNFIEKIENLENLKNLEILDLAYNRISKIENLENNINLVDLWMNNNLISDLKDIEHLTKLPILSTVYLSFTPVAKDPLYRKRIIEACKNIEYLDANLIRK